MRSYQEILSELGAKLDEDTKPCLPLQLPPIDPPPIPDPIVPTPGETVGRRLGGASANPLMDASTETLAPTLFVSRNGSDDNPGTRSAPWRTIGRVNAHHFEPGDVVGFERGGSYAGNLTLNRSDSGVAGNRVGLTAYGEGARPVINATHGGHGIVAHQTSHLVIEDLDTDCSRQSNGSTGIYCYNDLGHVASGVLVESTTIRRCTARNADFVGIHVRHLPANHTGYDGVTIDGCAAYGCGLDGISVQGRTVGRAAENHVYNIVNVLVVNSVGNDNDGGYSGHVHYAGNGIRIMGVAHGESRNCLTVNNGGKNKIHGGGPVGHWLVDCHRFWIRESTSHHNKSAGGDGGGFDIDGMARFCGIERCLSYFNHGAGFFHAQFALGKEYNASEAPTFRFNLSIGDVAPDYKQGALTISGGPGTDPQQTQDLRVYHNTIVTIAKPGDTNRMLYFNSAYVEGGVITSNIFLTIGEHDEWFVGDGPQGYYQSKGLRYGTNLYHQTGQASPDRFRSVWNNWNAGATVKETIAEWAAASTVVLGHPGFLGDGVSVDPLDYGLPEVSMAKDMGEHVAEAVGLLDFFGNTYPESGPVHHGAQAVG